MKVKMRYEYTLTKEGGEKETMQAMSWKKLFKSLLLKYPDFSGWCSYINKHGHHQVVNQDCWHNSPLSPCRGKPAKIIHIFLMGRNLISMHFTPSNMMEKEQYDSLVR